MENRILYTYILISLCILIGCSSKERISLEVDFDNVDSIKIVSGSGEAVKLDKNQKIKIIEMLENIDIDYVEQEDFDSTGYNYTICLFYSQTTSGDNLIINGSNIIKHNKKLYKLAGDGLNLSFFENLFNKE